MTVIRDHVSILVETGLLDEDAVLHQDHGPQALSGEPVLFPQGQGSSRGKYRTATAAQSAQQ